MKMKNIIKNKLFISKKIAAAAILASVAFGNAYADETCNSPYMVKIGGQEDFVYVWTLGVKGLGDGQDKLVTIDVNPKSKHYGKVVAVKSVGGRNEAHHSGFTDDRKYLWAGGLDSSKIFIFDVYTDPSKPKLVKVIDDFVSKSGGVVGPHTPYALPGKMIWTALSNNKDHGGRSALVEYTNDGKYIDTHWIPTDDNLEGAKKTGKYADGYNYDIQVMPSRNMMVTSSFTGWTNYMMDFGKLLKDKEAMKHFGNTVTIWNLHTKNPEQVLDVPGAPLELRCAWQPLHHYCFTSTALTSKIYLIEEDHKNGGWKATAVADIGNPKDIPLPVDISISSDDKTLWVDTFMDGKTRRFDISDPHHPKQTYEKVIGKQVNMVSESWDGKRVYYSTSLLSHWDKKGADDVQWVKGYHWTGKKLVQDFKVDFYKEKLGRAHQMRFGAYSVYGKTNPEFAKSKNTPVVMK